MTKTLTSREQWLNDATEAILDEYGDIFANHFGDDGIEHLKHLHVSTGFPSRGGLTKVIGECWKSKAAADGATHHIFINPRLDTTVEVLATLAHEMIHAADDGEHKHKGPFTRCARDLKLEGKPTATYAGPEFTEFAERVAKKIGPYTHVALVPIATEKKQTTRMLKLKADCCGYVVRTTQKWIDIGIPSCPCGNEFVQEVK